MSAVRCCEVDTDLLKIGVFAPALVQLAQARLQRQLQIVTKRSLDSFLVRACLDQEIAIFRCFPQPHNRLADRADVVIGLRLAPVEGLAVLRETASTMIRK
jgi:hypothetical protein